MIAIASQTKTPPAVLSTPWRRSTGLDSDPSPTVSGEVVELYHANAVCARFPLGPTDVGEIPGFVSEVGEGVDLVSAAGRSPGRRRSTRRRQPKRRPRGTMCPCEEAAVPERGVCDAAALECDGRTLLRVASATEGSCGRFP